MEAQQQAAASVEVEDITDEVLRQQEESTTENFAPRTTHGGARNTTSFGDKLTCLEMHNIKMFLQDKRCYCGNECLYKIFTKGEVGAQIVYNLRKERFTSTHALTWRLRHCHPSMIFVYTPGVKSGSIPGSFLMAANEEVVVACVSQFLMAVYVCLRLAWFSFAQPSN